MGKTIHIHVHQTRDAGEWEESKHPRAENGQFGKGSGGGTKPDANQQWSELHAEYKALYKKSPAEANAFYKKNGMETLRQQVMGPDKVAKEKKAQETYQKRFAAVAALGGAQVSAGYNGGSGTVVNHQPSGTVVPHQAPPTSINHGGVKYSATGKSGKHAAQAKMHTPPAASSAPPAASAEPPAQSPMERDVHKAVTEVMAGWEGVAPETIKAIKERVLTNKKASMGALVDDFPDVSAGKIKRLLEAKKAAAAPHRMSGSSGAQTQAERVNAYLSQRHIGLIRR